MNGAQPVNRATGQRGPQCDSATAAAIWIIAQPDARSWDWEPVPADGTAYSIPEIFQLIR